VDPVVPRLRRLNGDDPCRLLPPMLQGVQGQENELGGIRHTAHRRDSTHDFDLCSGKASPTQGSATSECNAASTSATVPSMRRGIAFSWIRANSSTGAFTDPPATRI